MFRTSVSCYQKSVWTLNLKGQNLSMKGNAEPNLKAQCRNRCSALAAGELHARQPPLLLSEVMWGSALLKCWYWSYSPEIPQNTRGSRVVLPTKSTVHSLSLWVAQRQLSFCFADCFHPGAEADTHWRQAEGMSWESAENHSEQNELISWEKMGAKGIGRFEVVCVPNRLCDLNNFEHNLFFSWNVQLLYL